MLLVLSFLMIPSEPSLLSFTIPYNQPLSSYILRLLSLSMWNFKLKTWDVWASWDLVISQCWTRPRKSGTSVGQQIANLKASRKVFPAKKNAHKFGFGMFYSFSVWRFLFSPKEQSRQCGIGPKSEINLAYLYSSAFFFPLFWASLEGHWT